MTTTEQLKLLLRAAASQPGRAGAFLGAFLDAPVYALAPMSDDNPRIRLFMYKRPDDGIYFVPLFTDEGKATAAAMAELRILSGTGRLWLQASAGAIVVVNPNDEHCTLYPEEIGHLLATGHVADLDREVLSEDRQVWIRDPESPPTWLIDSLRALYATLPFVDVARLFEMGTDRELSNGVLTVAVKTKEVDSERATRATITVIQPLCRQRALALDVVSVTSETLNSPFAERGILIYASPS